MHLGLRPRGVQTDVESRRSDDDRFDRREPPGPPGRLQRPTAPGSPRPPRGARPRARCLSVLPRRTRARARLHRAPRRSGPRASRPENPACPSRPHVTPPGRPIPGGPAPYRLARSPWNRRPRDGPDPRPPDRRSVQGLPRDRSAAPAHRPGKRRPSPPQRPPSSRADPGSARNRLHRFQSNAIVHHLVWSGASISERRLAANRTRGSGHSRCMLARHSARRGFCD